MILRRNKGRPGEAGYRRVNQFAACSSGTRDRAPRGGDGDMMALVASQLLGFILGGGIFLLRHDRGDFGALPW
jgi:hypothetical protein